MDRLISQFFATCEERDEYENLDGWITRHTGKTPRRGNDGSYKLWVELENQYTKVLSGSAHTTVIGEAEFEAAKAALTSEFDYWIITEWISHPMS
eukprot:CAMPEP_0119502512 /NCGR_PEP_ID=MMETSP1344-20130328/23962_1 /TAXON_ID=236787 /ORGANISM="Florenciella parvula, Strain CCMP2471" /LENGTH=94 /DNA_ID=CAMNT_0007538725 /DNA_START=93 /DNA_END=373 /DNA_ORIENTATION=-